MKIPENKFIDEFHTVDGNCKFHGLCLAVIIHANSTLDGEKTKRKEKRGKKCVRINWGMKRLRVNDTGKIYSHESECDVFHLLFRFIKNWILHNSEQNFYKMKY